MRDRMWIYVIMTFLVSEAWSRDPGTNQSTFEIFSTPQPLKVNVTRELSFNLRSDVNLTCSDKTWNETMYVIWTITLKSKQCKIAFSNNGDAPKDTCNDSKSLQNTSSSQSYLHIPNFSAKDVGVYMCELAYTGGMENYVTNVTIIVPPRISAWLEQSNNKMVAVCNAERGKPAANISWTHKGNSTSVETLIVSDGFATVESRLELDKDMDTENLICSIKHPYWEEEKILMPKLKKAGFFFYLIIPIVVVVTAFLLGLLFFAQKKLPMLRQCQQSNITQLKSPPVEDVEEVEPYASYVQRVNSIYN